MEDRPQLFSGACLWTEPVWPEGDWRRGLVFGDTRHLSDHLHALLRRNPFQKQANYSKQIQGQQKRLLYIVF